MIRWLLFSIFCFVSVVFSKEQFAESEYRLLTDIGYSANMIGIGNVGGFTGFSGDLFDNPASLHFTNHYSATLFTTKFMGEVSYKSLAAAYHTNFGTFGFGYMSSGVQGIPYTKKMVKDNKEEEIITNGSFAYASSLYKVAYQYSPYDLLHLGINVSYFRTEYDTVEATGFNSDLGIFMNVKGVDISSGVRNFLTFSKVKYSDTATGKNSSHGVSETVPLEIFFAARKNLYFLNLYAQLKAVGVERKLLKSVGVEIEPPFSNLVKFSLGYKEMAVNGKLFGVSSPQDGDDITKASSIVFGVGLYMYNSNASYSYERSKHPEYSGKHYFSVATNF